MPNVWVMAWLLLIVIAVGILNICGGVFAWDWYMNLPKVQFWATMMGRVGARVFCVLAGCVIMAIGAYWLWVLVGAR